MAPQASADAADQLCGGAVAAHNLMHAKPVHSMEPRGTLEGPAQELCIFGDMYGRTAGARG